MSLRVLHFIYDDPSNPWVGGGAAERVWEIYRRLGSEIDVSVIAGAYPGAETGEREGVRYEYVGLPSPYPLSRLTYGAAATRRLRAAEYDAAVFDFSVYTPLRVPLDRPVGHVAHMLIGPRASDRWGTVPGRLVSGRERRMLRRVRHLSVTSEWLGSQLRPLVPEGAGIRLVRSGVAPEFFDVVREERDHVLFYGRFDWFQKGLDQLLGVADPILEAHPDVRLVLAGRGKDADRVREGRAALKHSDRVEVVENPSRERVLDLFAGARALLHPSRFEGFPVAPAEAMAAGVPVVATRVGAMDEIIQSDDEGLLIPPEEPAALRAAVGRLLGDPELRARVGSGARRAAGRLAWDRVARDHLAFLDEVSRLSSE